MKLLRDRRLAALLAAETASTLGTRMTLVALPWFVLRTTGSPQRMSWVLIAEILPVALTGFWGGAVAARLGARRTMLTADLLRVPLFAAIPALHAAGLLSFPLLIALVAASGLFLAPYLTVQRTIVPDLVGEDHGSVAEAAALFQAANRITLFAGPLLAGLLIAAVGATGVLYVDAATYLVSFVLVAIWVHPPRFVAAPREGGGIRAAFRFIARDRLLRVWVPGLTVLDAGWTTFFACLPVLVVARFAANPHVLGFLFGGLGLGALAGALLALRIVRRLEPLKTTALCLLCQVASLWGVVAPAPWVAAVAAMAVTGVFVSLVNAPLHAFLTLRVPRDLRTQTLAVGGVFSTVVSPLGLVAVGWALSHHAPRTVIGVVLALQTAGILTIAATALRERSAVRLEAVDSPA
jgi:MFS family permease